MPLSKRYVDHPSSRVRFHLMPAWDRFDPAGYADEVLAQMDTQDFLVRVSSPETLCALPRLGPRPRLAFAGPRRLADIIRALPEGVRKISLSKNPLLQDLRSLTTQGSRDQVSLSACPELAGLSPLVDLGLTELYLHGLDGVSGPDRLTTLRDR
ncbi:hypothetical protein [Streptomyces sp. NBC_01171]|uniref:hypothetical protein n=1 Tax=Streptomyces sp. NBC_01171 TaxID=2903757 RepID=UPI00386F0199